MTGARERQICESSVGGESCANNWGALIYQDPVLLVFRQHNGCYSTHDALGDTGSGCSVQMTPKTVPHITPTGVHETTVLVLTTRPATMAMTLEMA